MTSDRFENDSDQKEEWRPGEGPCLLLPIVNPVTLRQGCEYLRKLTSLVERSDRLDYVEGREGLLLLNLRRAGQRLMEQIESLIYRVEHPRIISPEQKSSQSEGRWVAPKRGWSRELVAEYSKSSGRYSGGRDKVGYKASERCLADMF